MPLPTPVPWKPNSVDWPAPTKPFQLALVNWIVPVLPVRSELQWCVAAAPEGSVTVTVHPLIDELPAVTRIVATNPPGHSLSETVAVQPPPPGAGVVGGGAVVGGGELVGGGEVGPPSDRAGVCQSRHCDRLPAARLCIRMVPVTLPLPCRNL